MTLAELDALHDVSAYLAYQLSDGRILAIPRGTVAYIIEPVNGLGSKNGKSPPPSAKPRGQLPKKRAAGGREVQGVKERQARHVEVNDAGVRRVAEASGLTAAAKKFGKSYNALWYRAKAQGWKLPKRGKGQTKKRDEVSTDEGIGTSRRCESCYQLTRSDPCHQCGTKWKH